MIKPENLIVSGKGFFELEVKNENVSYLQKIINEYMNNANYISTSLRNAYLNKFLTLTYQYSLSDKNLPVTTEIKKGLGLLNEDEYYQKKVFKSLEYGRNEYPFEVDFEINAGSYNNKKGFIILISSQPVFLYKVRVLGYPYKINEFTYNDILTSNKNFIRKSITALGGVIIESPKAIAEYHETSTMERLKNIKFNKVASILKEGELKIKRGDTTDGLTDIRESINLFISNLLEKINEKPSNKIHDDLNKLKELGYIDHWMYELIENILYKWLYAYLSAKPVHKREKINYDDSMFIFHFTELLMEYLLDKVVLGR